jgi:hypothetical protein
MNFTNGWVKRFLRLTVDQWEIDFLQKFDGFDSNE